MSERSQNSRRPNLDSYPSVIDLTDDTEDRPVPPRIRDRSHSRRPPQLGRSDAVGFADFIDLTDDAEPDVIITGDRRLPQPLNNFPRLASPPRPRRDDSPSLFVPLNRQPLPPPPQNGIGRLFASPGEVFGALVGYGAGHRAQAFGVHDFMGRMGLHLYAHEQAQQDMPVRMDYQRPAFAQRKAEHVPPPPAAEGYTRSPVEGDVVICPSCEEELVHKKDEEPMVKKNGKAPTRKEREEHPFWVVKECGHVYCNHCYQYRAMPTKSSSKIGFQEVCKPGKGKGVVKGIGCCVEGCAADVKSKDRWVGVFL